MRMKVLFLVWMGLNSAFLFADENKYLNNNIGGWFFKKDTTFDNVGKNKKEQESAPDMGVKMDNDTITVQVPNDESIPNELDRQSNTQYEPQYEPQENSYILQTKPEKKVPVVQQNKNRVESNSEKPKYDIQLK